MKYLGMQPWMVGASYTDAIFAAGSDLRVDFARGYVARSIDVDLEGRSVRIDLRLIDSEGPERIAFHLRGVADFYTINRPPDSYASFGPGQAIIQNVDVWEGRSSESQLLLFQMTGLDICIEADSLEFRVVRWAADA